MMGQEAKLRISEGSVADNQLPSTLCNEAVEALDAAARTHSFDDDLLQTAPARDMRRQIEAMLTVLEKMDPDRVLARQGMISRLTGADIEARLEFELMGKRVMAVANKLRRAAENGKRIRTLLASGKNDLISENARLDAVIDEARQLLSGAHDPSDDFVHARFERRLSKLIAMRASNDLTVKQIDLGAEVLSGLLDRFTDVDTLLLPLWQRNVVALAHAAPGKAQRAAATDFFEIHKNLKTYLQQELSS